MDQHRDEGHHGDHHRRQRVVAQRPGDVETSGLDPGAESDGAGSASPPTSWKQANGPQGGGQQHAQDGHRYARRGRRWHGRADRRQAPNRGAKTRRRRSNIPPPLAVVAGTGRSPSQSVISALHQVHVLDLDRAAVAEIDRPRSPGRSPLRRRRRSARTSRTPGPTRSPSAAENATRLRLTESRISSIDIRMMMTFLRLRKMPKMPSTSRMARRP